MRYYLEDVFAVDIFNYPWWKDGVLKRDSEILAIGTNEEQLKRVHQAFHRFPRYANHHTILVISDRVLQRFYRAPSYRFPLVFQKTSSGRFIHLSQKQITQMIHQAKKLPNLPFTAHSNWTLQ